MAGLARREADISNVVAIGIDLVNVADVRRAVDDLGEAYLRRVFTADELDYCNQSTDPFPHLAARFAAKEATIKALMVAGAQPAWTSIEVWRDPQGGCELRLTGTAAELASQRGIASLAVSLTHEGDMAAAVVVASGS
jgi:holo-[acyl-carrier protein] synthase